MKKNGSAPRQASFIEPPKRPISVSNGRWTAAARERSTPAIRFFDHMLELLAKHGFFDLTVQAKGDIDIDEHHTVEDVGHRDGQGAASGIGRKGGDQAIRVCLGAAR